MVLYKNLYGVNMVLLLLNEHEDPSIFISKFNFLQYKQSSGKVWEKSQCRFYFRG